MNAIGNMGGLIVKYQYHIDTILLLILAVIILAVIIRICLRKKKKKDALEKIGEKAEGIENAVEDIKNKQDDIISGIEDLGREKRTGDGKEAEKESAKAAAEISAEERDIDEDEPENKDSEYVTALKELKSMAAKAKAEAAEEAEREAKKKADLGFDEYVPEGKDLDDDQLQRAFEKAKSASISTRGRGYGQYPDRNRDKKNTAGDTGREGIDDRIDISGIFPEEEKDVPKIYNSRDCNTDKFGNVYTKEDLEKQIN